MGLLDRLGLRESEPKSDAEVRVERVRALEVEHHASKELPIPDYTTLACGHRTLRRLRPHSPRPPVGLCEVCLKEAGQAHAGGKQPFVPASADREIHVDATHGVLDPRDVRSQPRGWQALTDRWLQERRASGEVLPNSEQELSALRRIEELRREEAEQERLRRLTPEERADLAQANYRKLRGLKGGMIGRYTPSPAKAGGR